MTKRAKPCDYVKAAISAVDGLNTDLSKKRLRPIIRKLVREAVREANKTWTSGTIEDFGARQRQIQRKLVP